MTITDELRQAINSFLSPVFPHSLEVTSTYGAFPETIRAELKGISNETHDTLVLMLKIIDRSQLIALPNLFIPLAERNQGYGFGLLDTIRTVANKNGYTFVITEIVPSFYERLLAKGAKRLPDFNDALLIDDEVNLLSHRI